MTVDRPLSVAPIRVVLNENRSINPEVANTATAGAAYKRSISCNASIIGTENVLRAGRDIPDECGGFQEAGTVVKTLDADSVATTVFRLEDGAQISVLSADVTGWLAACNACCGS